MLSVIFLSIYAAAQLTAGGVALEVMLNWAPTIGILIGFVLVVAYCYAGGIRASIWTDAAQSCVMIVGSTILCYVAIKQTGGFSGLHSELRAVDPAMVNFYPSELMFGATLWIAAFFLGGLGVAGQPQVVSRVMTLKDDNDRKQAMIWFFVWQTPFILLMFFIGLACRVLLPELGVSGAETGLPKLAMEQLNPFLGGLILASIFAATMSTADSQVLACTAAITDDVKPEWSQDHKTTKQVTLAVAVFATVISLVGQQIPGFGDSVFKLVVLAVYGLGAIFVPLLLVRMMGYEPDSQHTIAMMIAAMSGVVVWTLLGFGNADGIFPTVPGMGAAFATHFGFCWLRSESPDNPFGRYTVPKGRPMGIGVAVVLLLAATVEGSYLAFAPDKSEGGGVAGSYNVTANFRTMVLDNGGEYIADGETFSLNLSTDSLNDNSLNIVGAKISMSYSEDENSAGLGCIVSGGAAVADTITGMLMHNEFSGTESGQNQEGAPASHETLVEWYNASMIGDVSNVTRADIVAGLDSNGAGLGEYSVDISVEVGVGGAAGCQHTDDGENVDYTIEVLVLDYTITEIKA